jgi:hypothetical protein
MRNVILVVLSSLIAACGVPRQIAIKPIQQSRPESPGFTLSYQDYALPSARPEYNQIRVTELTGSCETDVGNCPTVWEVTLDARTSPRSFFYGQPFEVGNLKKKPENLVPGKKYRVEVTHSTVTGTLDRGAARFSVSK